MKLIVPNGVPTKAVLIDSYGNNILDQLNRSGGGNGGITGLTYDLNPMKASLVISMGFPPLEIEGIPIESVVLIIDGERHRIVKMDDTTG